MARNEAVPRPPRDRGMLRGHQGRLPTDEVVDRLIAFLKLGNTVKTSAAMCGLDPTTVAHWCREGLQETGREWCQEFGRKVDAARAYAQAAHLQVIREAAQAGSWQASAWFLERNDPQNWGRQERREVEITVRDPAQSRAKLLEALDALGDDLAEGFIDVESHEPEPEGEAGVPAPRGSAGTAESAGRLLDPGGDVGGLVVRREAGAA